MNLEIDFFVKCGIHPLLNAPPTFPAVFLPLFFFIEETEHIHFCLRMPSGSIFTNIYAFFCHFSGILDQFPPILGQFFSKLHGFGKLDIVEDKDENVMAKFWYLI